MFQEVADSQLSFEHEVLYGALGSDVVHSGPFSLGRIREQLRRRGYISAKPMPLATGRTIALAASNVAMLLVLDTLNEYAGLGLGDEIQAVKDFDRRGPEHDANGSQVLA
jgi:hypothetical protein